MKKYWQSLDELKETPEFLDSAKNEFAEDVPTNVLGRKNLSTSETENSSNNFSRRDFLKIMGFSVGAATLAACETPVNKTIPYVIMPEEITPGIANWYASTYFGLAGRLFLFIFFFVFCFLSIYLFARCH